LFLLFLFFAGCSSVQVSQDYLTDTSFNNLKTYQWQSETQKPTGNPRIDNPFLVSRIRTAVDQTLAKKGFQKINAGKPDFYVAYTYNLRSKIESKDVGTSFGFGFGRVGRFGSVGINTGQEVREYDQATLLLDLFNGTTQDLIWRGNGTRRVGEHSTPEEETDIVNEMVSKILEQFPPQPS